MKNKKYINKPYKEILNDEQCQIISDAFLDKLKNNNCIIESKEYFDTGCFGFYNLDETLFFLPQIDDIVRKNIPDIVFENTYTRMYQSNSCMKIHTHRPDLYYTLSVCVYSDLDDVWNLNISEIPWAKTWDDKVPVNMFTDKYISVNIEKGDGFFYMGSTHPHWRDTLYCNDKQKVIQTLYHWNILK